MMVSRGSHLGINSLSLNEHGYQKSTWVLLFKALMIVIVLLPIQGFSTQLSKDSAELPDSLNLSPQAQTTLDHYFTADNSTVDPEIAAVADQLDTESSTQIRRFHEVLDELLAEFGYDVRQGSLGKSIQNIAIRKVTLGETIPGSYKTYLGSLITERIQANSSTKIIH